MSSASGLRFVCSRDTAYEPCDSLNNASVWFHTVYQTHWSSICWARDILLGGIVLFSARSWFRFPPGCCFPWDSTWLRNPRIHSNIRDLYLHTSIRVVYLLIKWRNVVGEKSNAPTQRRRPKCHYCEGFWKSYYSTSSRHNTLVYPDSRRSRKELLGQENKAHLLQCYLHAASMKVWSALK